MKTFSEYHQEYQQLDEAVLEKILDSDELLEGRIGWMAKSAAGLLRAKQQAYQSQIKQEDNTNRQLELISEQIASMSSMMIVILAVMNKDRKGISRGVK